MVHLIWVVWAIKPQPLKGEKKKGLKFEVRYLNKKVPSLERGGIFCKDMITDDMDWMNEYGYVTFSRYQIK
jgi:hypothetical protein